MPMPHPGRHLQRGVVAIPRSQNTDHIRDNLQMMRPDAPVLSDDDMRLIAALDRHKRLTFDCVGVFEVCKLETPRIIAVPCYIHIHFMPASPSDHLPGLKP